MYHAFSRKQEAQMSGVMLQETLHCGVCPPLSKLLDDPIDIKTRMHVLIGWSVDLKLTSTTAP